MLLLLGILFCLGNGISADVRSFLKEMELIPDVFDENDQIPDKWLTVYAHGQKLVNGNEYSPTFLIELPQVEMTYDPDGYYTIMFISPDWVSREMQNLKYFIFWLKTNIRGNDINTGDTIIEYVTPAPFKSSGQGRGVVLLYKQPGKLTFNEPYIVSQQLENRSPWSLSNFLSKYKINQLEALFTGTTRWDETAAKVQNTFLQYKSKNAG